MYLSVNFNSYPPASARGDSLILLISYHSHSRNRLRYINSYPPASAGGIPLFYQLVTAATAATASAVAKEEEHEADSDYNPDIFTVEKVTQAVHSKPPFGESDFFFALILFYVEG